MNCTVWLALSLVSTLAANPARQWPPSTLEGTGLYADAASGRISADGRPFAPQYPLWTDGATKRRWVSLPRGASIDAKDPEAWVFPVGTRFWKEFSFNGRKVETRYIEKTGKGTWVFAAYVWAEDQRQATLAPPDRGLRNAAEIAPGVRHDVPSVSDCKGCHEGNGRDSVLGFGALQLSPDRDPLAPHADALPEGALDLAGLLAEKRLKNPLASWQTSPPVIVAGSPRARAALGYLHANCSHCHNDRDPVSSVGLSLRAALSAANEAEQPGVRTAVGVKSKFQIVGVAPEAAMRLAPGAVDHSSLLVRMKARDGLTQMPPLGSKLVDQTAVDLIGAWVSDDLQHNGAHAQLQQSH